MSIARGHLACTLSLGMSLFATPAVPAISHAAQTVRVVAPRHLAGAPNQSDNWSGYNIGIDYPGIALGTKFSSISSEWVVPTAKQHKSGQAEDSASWVGIGGGCIDDTCAVTDETLIQAGTEQDVSSSGQASYDAWYELIPETETETSLVVHPGNTIKVSISEISTEKWSIVIDNVSTADSFSTTQVYPSTMDTAEWIEETPLEIGTSGTGLAAMPTLGTVHFRDAQLNGANPSFQTIDQMQLADDSTILATPSAPNKALDGFNDCTYATTCAAP